MKKQEETKKEHEEIDFQWADGMAEQLIKTRAKSKKYTCAAGITPSGTVHIGNFREVITVDLIVRALKENEKETRFIYSWDNIDRLRKIPKNLPEKKLKEFEKYIGMPVTKVPDPFSCHKNYAEHFQEEFSKYLPEIGIFPEFINQAEMYSKCKYAEEIKFVLENKERIKEILNNYKAEEKISEDWWPVQVYCDKCGKDTTQILSWEDYTLEYECGCGYLGKTNFKKNGNVKLPWRIDWPMRQNYEKVDFEPAGKEHSTPGGSITTSDEIIKKIWQQKPPLHLKYDFITVKGSGGKMSSSLGNVITLKECLEIYEPEIIRYLFTSYRPNVEFAISFDLDVLKIYTDYDALEEEYFKKETNEKEKRIYELSQVKSVKEKKPERINRIGFRQIAELIQVKPEKEIIDYLKEEGKIKTKIDEEALKKRILLAKNWLKYAPEEFLFSIQKDIDKKLIKEIPIEYKKAIKELAGEIKKAKEEEIIKKIKEVIEKNKLDIKEFFKYAYQIIIGKEKGPRLSSLINYKKEEILDLLSKI